ncbi:hypothetical protein GGP41_004186 [Bipolaris sorokiniana]|uniref:Uncharacterized protein n=2 Tax=Cochliobolus sativus TaxID=45130 RepID=A0A8H5ZL54_COCSA|nr:uncharacterized protein COCSADRAFT_192493 [Bipolaris sorokiniana ND90Pr]EMD61586.1 hypothetical protein COCSADRAFT_192493 [Bipolaris sorokiniana ND90Pr]KAF5851362.1 hypothetical protein GGP41_004186 [Bipolaris sorokiniana]
MEPFIQTISVSKVTYPLYDHIANPIEYYFSLNSQYIWDKDTKKSFPVAISNVTTFAIAFPPTVVAKEFLSLKAPFSIAAKLGTMAVFSKTFSQPTDPELSKLVLQHPTTTGVPGGATKDLPWCYWGELDWELKGSDPKDPIFNCKTQVEFYVLPATLPEYFDTSGIPLALLRETHYLSAWMKDPETDWIKFVTNALYSDSRLEYEIYNGSSKYVSSRGSFRDLFTNNIGLDFWLDLWLSDLKGVVLQKAKHTVNCYDLAAICQALVSLGVDSSTQIVRMKYMDPYGFINPTNLIGRKEDPPNPMTNPKNLCNNPFYGKVNGLPMLCGEDEVKRSAFSNHMFVTISKGNGHNVLDACCGPQLGDVTLEDYVNQAIDSRASRYQQNNNPLNYKLGDASDITDGQGIAQLVTSRCFEKEGDTSQSALSLLDKLAKEFENDGKWYQPYLSTPQGNWQITATWTFKPNNNLGEIITVNVFGYSYYAHAPIEYDRRKNAIQGWVPNAAVGDDDAFNDTNVTGSSRMFYSTTTNPCYLCTIDTRVGKASTIVDFGNRIKSVLNNSLTGQSHHSLGLVTANSKGPIKVGSSVTLSAQGSPDAVKYWRGFNIRIPRSNVLFTKCDVNTNGVDFHILARKAGFVTIVISMFGGNLEVSERYINLQVINP